MGQVLNFDPVVFKFMNEKLKTSRDGLEFITKWEGCVLKPYKDVAGLRTIGVGHLIKPGENFPDDVAITREKALEILAGDVLRCEVSIKKNIKVALNQNQFDALVSFGFNCGTGVYSNSNVATVINSMDLGLVPEKLMSWNKARVNGTLQEVKGLTNRRKEEGKLFMKPVDGAVIADFPVPWTKEGLASAQEKLKKLGLYDLRVDGIWGPGSKKAVLEFAKLCGIEVADPSRGVPTNLLAELSKKFEQSVDQRSQIEVAGAANLAGVAVNSPPANQPVVVGQSSQTPATVAMKFKAPIINIIDRSTLLSDADHALMVEACKFQLENHVAPLWNRGSWKIVEDQPDSVGYPIVIIDDPDQAGVLGYHSKSPGGKVWGRVFIKPILNRGGSMLSGPLSVSAVLSHEVIEAYCNPDINIWARRKDGLLVAYEACDPVENDCYEVITTSGKPISVSNFVLPSWFDPNPEPGTQFDYMKRVSSPYAMSKNGYIITLDARTGKFQNVYGSKLAEELHAKRQDPSPAARSTRMSTNESEESFLSQG